MTEQKISTNKKLSGKKVSEIEPPLSFLDEKDLFKILLNQMQGQLVQIKEQEVAIVKEKALALLEGEEKERMRVSREIHDGIGQMLTAIKLIANSIKDQDELKQELKSMIDDTISEARRVSFNLMPSVLLNFGLIPSVKILAENAEKYAGVKVNQSYSRNIILTEISFEKAVTLYRLIQEALNNSLKHAQAKNISIQIENKQQLIHVLVEDDGVGFTIGSEKNPNSGKGLSNMSQRAELSGGKCTIESIPNKGTKVVILIPL